MTLPGNSSCLSGMNLSAGRWKPTCALNPPELFGDLNLQAYHWHREAGITELMFAHALAAGQHNLAAEIIEHNAMEMLADGKLFTIESWIARLPGEMLQMRPMLAICCAWVLVITRRFEDVPDYLSFAMAAKTAGGNPEEVEKNACCYQSLFGRFEKVGTPREAPVEM